MSQRLRNRNPKLDPRKRLVAVSMAVLLCALASSMFSTFVGCVDGPLFALKSANPYFRSQWKEDQEKGIVFSKRQEEIRLVRTQISTMPESEQARWIAELAKVAEYETSPELKRDAVMALGATLHSDAEAPLIRACSDKNDKVRMAACKAMAGRKTTTASQTLASIAQSDKNMSVRSAAIRSLGSYQTDEAKAMLRKSLDEKSPVLQHDATIALKTMTGREFGGDVRSWRKFLDGEPVEEPEATLADRIQSTLLLK